MSESLIVLGQRWVRVSYLFDPRVRMRCEKHVLRSTAVRRTFRWIDTDSRQALQGSKGGCWVVPAAHLIGNQLFWQAATLRYGFKPTW